MAKKKIRIKAGKVNVLAELNNSKIANLIWEALPLSCSVNTWGEEIYFSIPVQAELNNPRDVVEKGDLGYWPDGPAFCIFFGPTPVSSEGQIRPASSVEIVGRVCGNPEDFKQVGPGVTITLERLSD